MRGRKVTAFVLTYIALMVTAIGTIIFAPNAWMEFSKWFVIGLMANSFGFISFTVIKDFIRSKYYRDELHNGGK